MKITDIINEEYDPSYDPEYRPYQRPEPDPDSWKQDRDNRDDKESSSIVYITDGETGEVVLRFKSTGEYWGDLKYAASKGVDLENPDYDVNWKRKKVDETATAGSTSAGNIATVDAPHLSPGKARGKKSYIGSPGKSGTKAPPQPKVVQPKTSAGTAVNALDMKGASLFGGGTVKR